MNMLTRILATTILLAAPFLAVAARSTQVGSLSLSPDGRYVAGIAYTESATAAFLMDLEADAANLRLLAKPERDPRYVYGQIPIAVNWVTNDLLAVDYNNRESVSIDLSGKQVASLGERFIRRMSKAGPLAESVLVYRDEEDGDIDLVNARTGNRQRFRVSLPGKPAAWAFDESGELRAVTMIDSSRWSGTSKISNWYRRAATQDWQLLQEWPVSALNEVWYPFDVLPQADTLAVSSRQGRDTWAVFKYDAVSRQHVELMAAHARDDILLVEGLDAPNVERVITGGLRPQTFWFDARWASLQAGIDAALPGRTNDLQGDKNGRVLVTSYGDVDPGRWYVLDTRTSKLREIVAAMPKIDPAGMHTKQTMRYAARDGLSIPAYLTRPAGSDGQPAPTVVLIHGGPHVRDRWDWDQEVQMLAESGYVVFQPQFRGSSGFGRRFEDAGYRQWGRSMQDDIADGVRYLVQEKIADPARVCIVGASYGGYAAMWGAIKTPELYRCAASFAGVSDLADWLSSGLWDDTSPVTRAIRRDRIGDPDKDRIALDEISPLKHADRLRTPIFIAHGSLDRRVLASQSRAMVEALKRAGQPVEWMWFDEDGHGFSTAKSRVRYYAALLDFLGRHLAPPQQQAEKAP